MPIGAEDRLRGLVDLTTRAAYEFHGAAGEEVTPVPLPGELAELVEARRAELVERVRGQRPTEMMDDLCGQSLVPVVFLGEMHSCIGRWASHAECRALRAASCAVFVCGRTCAWPALSSSALSHLLLHCLPWRSRILATPSWVWAADCRRV